MYGVVTRNSEELTWPEFDLGFYEVKDVTGREAEPQEEAVNMVSCFGDNATAEADPSMVPVDPAGNRATREQPYFDWAYICPTDETYREGLLSIIDDCAAVNEDVRLDDVGFPRAEYCHCERCTQAFEASECDDRFAWRESVITDFVATASDRIPGRTYLTLYPDPYPGHLRHRTGIDPAAVSSFVDEFVVPIYDMAYSTTYWVEILASGFEDELPGPFSVELYAVNVDVDSLISVTEVAAAYAKDVFFGYDSANARATIRRMKADERDGVSHGPS